MENVLNAAKERLAVLGYAVSDEDIAFLKYLVSACEAKLLANINQYKVPEGLFFILIDMVAGEFLQAKKASGGLIGFDFAAPVKSISEGDVSVTFAGASDGVSTAEVRFDALLSKLMNPPESVLSAYRRLKW